MTKDSGEIKFQEHSTQEEPRESERSLNHGVREEEPRESERSLNHRLREEEISSKKSDRNLRDSSFKFICYLTTAVTIYVGVIIPLSMIEFNGINPISEKILLALIAVFSIHCIGAFVVITKGLFFNRKDYHNN